MIETISKIVSINQLCWYLTAFSGDGYGESFSANSFEVVGLGLGSNSELKFLNESVFKGSSFLDVNGVRALCNGIVFQVNINCMFAMFKRIVCDGVSSVIIVFDLSRDIS